MKKELKVQKKAEKKENKKTRKAFKNKSKIKLATFSTGIIVGVIAIIVALNVVLNLLVERYPIKLDLTNEKIYQLTDDTVELLKTVNTPVKITFLTAESSLPTYYKELLDNYKRYCSNLSVVCIDAEKNPDYLKNEGIDTATSSTLVAVKSDKRYKLIEYTDMYDDDYNSKAEEAISSAIVYVTKDVVYDVMFIDGHGETYSDSLKSSFSNNGYNVVTTNIKKSEITTNTKAIIINSPTSDFSADDIDALDTILTNSEKYGINAFLFTGTATPKLENLETYLGEWGISLGTEKVIEDSSNLMLYYGFQRLTYPDETLAGSAASYDFYAGIGEARPVNILFTEKGSVTSVISVLSSSDDSYGKPAGTEIASATDIENDDGDTKGPFNIAVMSTKMTYDSDNNELKSNFIVSGTTAFTDENYIGTSSIGNGRYLINLLNNVSGLEDSDFAIVAKTVTSEVLDTAGNLLTIFTVIFIFLLPVGLIIIGVIIFLKRKHL